MYKHFEIISFHWIAVSVCKKCITTPALSAGGNNQEDPSQKHCQQATRRENWHYFSPAQTQRLMMKVDTTKEALRKAWTLGGAGGFLETHPAAKGERPALFLSIIRITFSGEALDAKHQDNWYMGGTWWRAARLPGVLLSLQRLCFASSFHWIQAE